MVSGRCVPGRCVPGRWRLLTLVVLAALAAGACGLWPPAFGKTRVRLQLNGEVQARFAGYYAAREKGFYAQENLVVRIIPGRPDVTPEQVVARGRAEFGVAWLPALLVARDQGAPLVNIAQIFAHSGLRQVAFRDSGIRTPADLKGKKIAVWFGGSEYALLATLAKYGLDRNRDVTLVQQPPNVDLFVKREVDAASVMAYDEYWEVLDAGVHPRDLVVIDFNREGTAMLEDGIFVKGDWLQDAGHKEVAARFLRATLRGWEFCRDNRAECVEIVLKQNPSLRKAHQAWMMAKVNALVWGPSSSAGEMSPSAAGRMDPAAFQRTAGIALRLGVIRKAPDAGAYTDEVWEMAVRR